MVLGEADSLEGVREVSSHALSATFQTPSGHLPRHVYCILLFVLDYSCVIRPQNLRVFS